MSDDTQGLRAAFQRLHDASRADTFVDKKTREDRLDRMLALVFENDRAIVDAVNADFGSRSSHQTRMGEVYATLESLRHAKKHVGRWMKPERRGSPFPMGLVGARARIEHQPKGVVGILGTWNFPVNTVLAPLSGVLAGGNRALLKPSEVTPRTAALLAELIAKRFDPSEIACVTGGPELGAAFASLPLDHLVFTGSASIGRAIMRAASENLVPLTLELGGKSPVIVAPDANLQDAAIRIMTGKSLNAGQVCLAPDYVFVQAEKLEAFVGHMTTWTTTMYPTAVANVDHTSIVNARHRRRLSALLDDARARGVDVRSVNPANEDFDSQTTTNKLPFTFVIDPPEEAAIMQEEIFGPLLVVKPYRELDECLRYINAHPRPLGLYLFSKDVAVQERVIHGTRSGGMSINDVLAHVANDDLPFGGIGPSGSGHYHGREGFLQFTHARAIQRQAGINLQKLSGMVPPFGADADKNLARIIRR